MTGDRAMRAALYALAVVAVFAATAGMFWGAITGHEWLMGVLLGVIVVAGKAADNATREIDAAQREVEESSLLLEQALNITAREATRRPHRCPTAPGPASTPRRRPRRAPHHP